MKTKDHKCDKCQSACKTKPGWFSPEQPKKVAEYLSITLKELFNTKLMIDWWEADEVIFIIAPAILQGNTGGMYPSNPNGKCVFFKKGLCEIHEVKPIECREYICTEKAGLFIERHKKTKNLWDNEQHQNQIKQLLGKNPVAKSYGFMDSFSW